MWWAEIRVLFKRTRVRVLLALLIAVPALLNTAVAVLGGPSAGNGPTFLDRVSHNGVFAALAGLVITIPLLLPLAVAMVAGDSIAGEAGLGTLRYLLVRPAGRSRLLVAKAVSVGLFCVVASLVVVISGLVVGAILFPLGPVTTLSGTTIPMFTGIGRTLLAALIVGASLFGLAAIAMFLSTLTDHALAAMVGAVAITILAAVVEGVPEISVLHPWMFTDRWLAFGDLLRTPVVWGNIAKDLLLQLAYVAVFGAAAWAQFSTKDVLA